MAKPGLMRIFRILAANIAVLAVLLSALELILAISGRPYYGSHYPAIVNGTYIRKHLANAPYEYKQEGYSRGRFNSHGFLDHDRTIDKPEGMTRIAILGDSIVEAIQVPMQDNFTGLLEKRLNSSGLGRFEALNFGISGYGTADEYLLLKHDVVNYKPDIVVLTFLSLNDVATNYPLLDRPNRRVYFNIGPQGELVMDDSFLKAYLNSAEGKLRSLLDGKSRVFRILMSIYRDMAFYKIYKEDVTLTGNRDYFPEDPLYCDDIPEDYKAAWRITERLITEIKDESKKAGARFLLMSVPLGWQLEPKDKWDKLEPPSSADRPEQILREISEENNIDYLDLLPVFLDKRSDTALYPYFMIDNIPGHMNATGHEWVADALFEYITNKYLKKR